MEDIKFSSMAEFRKLPLLVSQKGYEGLSGNELRTLANADGKFVIKINESEVLSEELFLLYKSIKGVYDTFVSAEYRTFIAEYLRGFALKFIYGTHTLDEISDVLINTFMQLLSYTIKDIEEVSKRKIILFDLHYKGILFERTGKSKIIDFNECQDLADDKKLEEIIKYWQVCGFVDADDLKRFDENPIVSGNLKTFYSALCTILGNFIFPAIDDISFVRFSSYCTEKIDNQNLYEYRCLAEDGKIAFEEYIRQLCLFIIKNTDTELNTLGDIKGGMSLFINRFN